MQHLIFGVYLALGSKKGCKSKRCMASLRGGLLRLMMTGFVFLVFGPSSFLLGFIITEVIALFSQLNKEDMHMVKEAVSSSENRLLSYSKSLYKACISALGAHLPYRQSLLMSS